MHISVILAGTLLARLGRPEVSNCIAGLKQYSYAYEEAGDQADDMNRLFSRVRMGESDLHHMATAVPRVGASSNNTSPHGHDQHNMNVDEHRPNGSSHVCVLSFRSTCSVALPALSVVLILWTLSGTSLRKLKCALCAARADVPFLPGRLFHRRLETSQILQNPPFMDRQDKCTSQC